MPSDEKVYSPYVKPRGIIAMRARVQAIYGLATLTKEAQEGLSPLVVDCPACGATGLAGTYGGMGWLLCPRCHGLGVVYRDLEEFLARRREIIIRQPEVEIPDWTPSRPYRCPVLDLKRNIVIDACPEDEPPRHGELPLES